MDAPDIPVLTTYLAPQRPMLVIDILNVKRLLPEGGEIMVRAARKAKRQEGHVILAANGTDAIVDQLLGVAGASREFLRAKAREEAIKSAESLLRQRLTKSLSSSRVAPKLSHAEEQAATQEEPKEKHCPNCKAKVALDADRCYLCGMLLSDRQTMLFHKPEFEPCPSCQANMLIGSDKCPLCGWTKPQDKEPEKAEPVPESAPPAAASPGDDAVRKAKSDLDQIRRELADSARELIDLQEKRSVIQQELSELELKKFEIDGRFSEQERRAGQRIAELEGKAGLIEVTLTEMQKKREDLAREIADQEAKMSSVTLTLGAAAVGGLTAAAMTDSAVFGATEMHKAEADALKEEIATLSARRDELQAGIEQIRMLAEKTRSEAVDEIERERKALASETDEARLKLNETRAEAERARGEVESTREELAGLGSEKQRIVAELERARNAAAASASEERAKIEAEVARETQAARDEIGRQQAAADAVRAEVARLADKRAEMELEIATQTDQASQVRSAVEEARGRIAELRAESDAVQAERDAARDERDRAIREKEDSVQALQDRFDGLRADFEARAAEKGGIERELDRLHGLLETERLDIDRTLTAERAALVEKLSADCGEVEALRAEREKITAERDQVSAAVLAVREELAKVEASLADARASKEAADAAIRAAREDEAAAAESTARLASVRHELDAAGKTLEEIKAAAISAAQDRDRIVAETTQEAALRAQALGAEADMLASSLDRERIELGRIHDDRAAEEERARQLSATLAELQARHDELLSRIGESEQAAVPAEPVAGTSVEEIRQVRGEAAELMAAAERLRMEVEHRRGELAGIHHELDALRLERNEVEREVQDRRQAVERELLEERESQAAELREKREEIERDESSRREEIERQIELRRTDADRDQEAQRAESERSWTIRREEAEKALAEIESRSAAAAREAERWQAEQAARKAEVDALEERRQALSRIESEHAALATECDRRRGELEEIESRIAEARREMEAAGRPSVPPESASASIDALTRTLLDAIQTNTQAIEKLRTDATATPSTPADAAASDERYARMRDRFDAAVKEADDARRAGRDLELRLETSEHRAEEAGRRLEEALRRMEEAETRARMIDRGASEAERRIAEAERRADDAVHRAEEAERRSRQAASVSMSMAGPVSAEIDEWRDKLEAERSLRESLEQKYNAAAAELDLAKMRMSQVNDPYRDVMKDVERERKGVEEAIERLRKERDSIRREKEFELKSMEILKREIGRWMRERIKISSEQDAELIMAMRSEIDRLRAEKYEAGSAEGMPPAAAAPDLTLDLQKLRDENMRIRDELARLKQESSVADAGKIGLGETVAREKDARLAAEKSAQEFKLRIAFLEEKLGVLERASAGSTESEAAMRTMRTQIENLESKLKEAAVERSERERLEKTIADLETEVRTLSEEKTEQEKSRAVAEKMRTELEEATEAESRAALAVRDLEAERDELVRRLAEKETADQAMLAGKTGALQGALDKAQREVEEAREEMRDAAAEIKALSERLEAEMRGKDEAAASLAGLRRESDALTRRREELLAELARAKEELAREREAQRSGGAMGMAAAVAAAAAVPIVPEVSAPVEQVIEPVSESVEPREEVREEEPTPQETTITAELEGVPGSAQTSHESAHSVTADQRIEPEPKPAELIPSEPPAPEFVARPEEEALSIEALRQRAFDEEDAGRSTEAFRIYNLILMRDAGNISALHNLALIRYRSGDIDGALLLCARMEGLKKELPRESRKLIAEVRRHRSSPSPVWGKLFGR